MLFVQFPESNASTMRLAHSCWQGGNQFVSAPVLPSGLLARCRPLSIDCLGMLLTFWVCLSLPWYLAAVKEDWEQALVHFGLQMPEGVTDANFYRTASGASDYVSPLEVIQLNPALSPAGALREACFSWPDFVTNPPNWQMNRVLHRPTYMVLRRGVDALLAMRPHGLIEILGLAPHAINEVFPTVLPERVNRLLILRLLGNLETFCHRFIDCRVWVNGEEIDTRMIMISHGFYILVRLQATTGADVVMAAEATSAIVRQGRFYHVAVAPSVDILHCPGGRTLASCRTMHVHNHPDLPAADHLRQARDQWPDLLGVALRKFHVHHAVRACHYRGCSTRCSSCTGFWRLCHWPYSPF